LPATDLGYISIPDATIGRHFSHHPQFAARHPGRDWRFRKVRVPLGEFRCLYSDPGVQPNNPAGLMGGVGKACSGYADVAISELARTVGEALVAEAADLANPAVQKIVAFRDGGPSLINSVSEPLAVSRINGKWFVREGTHRAVALALIGTDAIDAIDFESAELT